LYKFAGLLFAEARRDFRGDHNRGDPDTVLLVAVPAVDPQRRASALEDGE